MAQLRGLGLAALTAACRGGAEEAFHPVRVPWPEDHELQPVSRRNNYCGILKPVEHANELVRALAGRQVSVVFRAFEVPGVFTFVSVDNRTGMLTGGYLVEIVDEMARRGKFTWRNSFAVVGWGPQEAGHLADDDHEAIADWAVANYDLFAEWVTWNPDRVARGHIFLVPILDMSLRLIVQPSQVLPEWYEVFFAFLRPFSFQLWAGLALLFVVVASVYKYIEHDGPDFADELVKHGRCGHALYLTLSAFTAGGALSPRSLPGKFLHICFMFTVMLFVASYTANLASLLVVQGQMIAPVQSLYEAALRQVPICNSWGIGRPVLARVPGLRVHHTQSPVESMELLRKGRCGAAIGRHALWVVGRNTKAYNPGCTLAEVPGRILPVRNGFACQQDVDPNATRYCTVNAAQVFNTILLEMSNDGWLDNLDERYREKVEDQSCPIGWPSAPVGEDDGSRPLKLREFCGVFVLFGVGTVFALVWRKRFHHDFRQVDHLESEDNSESDKCL